MVDAKVFIGKNECEACQLEDKKPELKWGIVIRMNDQSVFICEDCLGGMIEHIQVVKKKEKEGVIKVGSPPKI